MNAAMTEAITVRIARQAASTTLSHLRSCGRRGVEGMVLWAGTVTAGEARVEEAIVPVQDGRITVHGLIVTVSGDELHRINVHLYKTGLKLIAQVHSHPGHAYHSAVDDEYAIATEVGAFSIVVPDFAEGPFEIGDYAVYRLREGRWPWQKRPSWKAVHRAQIVAIFHQGGE